jgi:hypothetical protein
MILPNRKERRKLAKDMGLFGKKKNINSSETSERSRSIGKLIHLRNLTEQRNSKKKS